MYSKKMTSIAAFLSAIMLFAGQQAFAHSQQSTCDQYLSTTAQEATELKNQQAKTTNHDPYIRRANATVVIDNKSTD